VAAYIPKRAFYKIWIEVDAGIYTVLKESGVMDKVLDKRAWRYETLDEARNLFDRRVKAKTNPYRKSPRKYQLINQYPHK
jgi:hypothetical protein